MTKNNTGLGSHPVFQPVDDEPPKKPRPARKDAQETAQTSAQPRKPLRKSKRNAPTRNEVQEFNFILRDEWMEKVQVGVPKPWKTELEDMARKINVNRTELYRYIIGEYLGKVERGGGER